MSREATIQEIIQIKPHPNADNLEIASVLGWQLVVGKDEFKAGDWCVFVTIDSILPDAEWSAFLKNKRIKTIRLRGEISQGLALPTSILGQEYAVVLNDDVSEMLGIIHYEKPLPAILDSGFKNWFPTHLVSRTDEVSIQGYPNLLEEMEGRKVVITSKYDGASVTFIWYDSEFRVCSRNVEKKLDDGNIYSSIARRYDLASKLAKLNRRIAIQGEIVGPGIQGNKVGLKETELRVFQIYDIDNTNYLQLADMNSLCHELNIPTVEIVEIIENFNLSIENLVEKAKGQYNETGNIKEGIVVRPIEPVYSTTINKMLSFKVINVDYAIKNGE